MERGWDAEAAEWEYGRRACVNVGTARSERRRRCALGARVVNVGGGRRVVRRTKQGHTQIAEFGTERPLDGI